MSIAITGASGQLGRATTEAVLATLSDPSQLVLITRTPAQLSDLAERGVLVRAGDFDQPAGLADAFAGVERLLLISTDAVGTRLEGHVAAIEAAKAAGVQQVVYTSVTDPQESNPAGVVPDHAGTEQALKDSGLQWTFLRNNLYAQLQIPVIQQAIASGQLVGNTGDGATAYLDRGDAAAVAAAVLTGGGHAGETYEVTGPDALTATDVAALASELGSTEVAVVDVSDADYIAGLVEHAGFPEPVAGLFASFGQATREGYMGNTTSVVADLTGRPARSLRDVVEPALAAGAAGPAGAAA